MKRQISEWEKVLANESTHKVLMSKIYKQLIQLNIRKNIPIKKWADDLNRYFSKEDIEMVNTHKKRWSTMLVIGGKHIKTTMRYNLMPVRMAIIKNLQTINAREDVEKREPPCTVGRNRN